MNLHHISLFSGIGGFELAMAEAGIPTIAACEIDKKARGVLRPRTRGRCPRLHSLLHRAYLDAPQIPTQAAALAACMPTDSPWRRVARAGGR